MCHRLRGVPTCCAVDWRWVGMPLSCCGFLVDLEGVKLVAVNCLLLLLGWVGLVEGLVDQHAVMLTLRMKPWWVAAVLRELGVIRRELGLLPLG